MNAAPETRFRIDRRPIDRTIFKCIAQMVEQTLGWPQESAATVDQDKKLKPGLFRCQASGFQEVGDEIKIMVLRVSGRLVKRHVVDDRGGGRPP